MFLLLIHVVLVISCMFRILLRRHRQPESRLAWVTVVLAVPFVGVLAYLLLGETNIGRKRTVRLNETLEKLPRPEVAPGWDLADPSLNTSDRYQSLFTVGEAISGYKAVGGNRAQLMGDSEATIDAMVADIDAARDHVHLIFYIWLTDDSGMKVVEALKRAAGRGVQCRAMVDDLGSRGMVRSQAWKDMAAAGVQVACALEIGNPLVRAFEGRIDLRNHRKILVIDNDLTYCGSQNCADAAFLPKAKFAPWVDTVMRFEGPVARQNQHLFASDWMTHVDEDLSDLLRRPLPPKQPGFVAQVVGTGPTTWAAAMSELFETLMYCARNDLFITTPYYVPNAPLQAALCAAAKRGVDTTIIFPKRNDDFAVGATARSYYEELLTAGVKIYEYRPGILHAKTMTIDTDISFIGSANMDRRSFDLNYENNILLRDTSQTAQLRARQITFLSESNQITLEEVQAWPWQERLWNNALAIFGPVL
ncbi:cardiolipin synthase [Tateyamaria pelophila]|uniref:cardiolipin synthase n=1 Tax=Tateyamaria pelophila TaxID=328415 RepID=UPI001CBE515E|nr:cardiolipin synthase [Tateyamaria pelophila]